MRPTLPHAVQPSTVALPRRRVTSAAAAASDAAYPRWRRLCCAVLLALGLAALTTAPAAQPVFADEWCSTC